MSYYDSVKENVDDSNDTSRPSFDTLREAAEENSRSEDEREGDDTDIEVLEDGLGGDRNSGGSGIEEIGGENDGQEDRKEAEEEKVRKTSQAAVNGNGAVEEKLDTLIDQNERIIKILESFGS
ncbi:MAG: hypothetical protein ABEJ03_02200 [Candidatus Nanohaloarchaea archaeon]